MRRTPRPGLRDAGRVSAPHACARAPARIAVACLSLVALLALAQGLAGVPGDRALFDAVHARAAAVPAGLLQGLHAVGYWRGVVPLGALVVAALAASRRWRDMAFAAVALGGGLLLNAALKLAVGRARPPVDTPAVIEATLSFPSGHAQASASLATVLVLLAWRSGARVALAAGGGAFAVAVGLSRVAAGVHYPADVLAGWLLGVGWACAIAALPSFRRGSLGTGWRRRA